MHELASSMNYLSDRIAELLKAIEELKEKLDEK